jgi:hypothetical protein
VRDRQEKIKLKEEKTILEILCADTHSKSGVEASNDEDYFEEEVWVQEMFWDSPSTPACKNMYPAALLCVFLRPEKGNSVMCQM